MSTLIANKTPVEDPPTGERPPLGSGCAVPFGREGNDGHFPLFSTENQNFLMKIEQILVTLPETPHVQFLSIHLSKRVQKHFALKSQFQVGQGPPQKGAFWLAFFPKIFKMLKFHLFFWC